VAVAVVVAAADVGAVAHVAPRGVVGCAAAGRVAVGHAAARGHREAAQDAAIMHNTSPITRTIRRVRGACTCARMSPTDDRFDDYSLRYGYPGRIIYVSSSPRTYYYYSREQATPD
jgi:hypothetical protein